MLSITQALNLLLSVCSSLKTHFYNFYRFLKNGVTADSMEGMYKKAHAAIRADPAAKAKAAKKVEKKRWTAKKIGGPARKAKIAKQKEEFLAQLEQMKE